MIIKDHKKSNENDKKYQSKKKFSPEMVEPIETTPQSSFGSEDNQIPYFKVTKYCFNEALQIEEAKESISHDQFLNPKPMFLEKLERQREKYTLHMSVKKANEDDESPEESVEHSNNIENHVLGAGEVHQSNRALE